MPPPYEILSDDESDECPTCSDSSSDEEYDDYESDECPTCSDSSSDESSDESCCETYCKYCCEKK